jgi:hypothetical protein
MAGGCEVHQVSDDVTFRYFKPRSVDPQGQPVANGSSQIVAR